MQQRTWRGFAGEPAIVAPLDGLVLWHTMTGYSIE